MLDRSPSLDGIHHIGPLPGIAGIAREHRLRDRAGQASEESGCRRPTTDSNRPNAAPQRPINVGFDGVFIMQIDDSNDFVLLAEKDCRSWGVVLRGAVTGPSIPERASPIVPQTRPQKTNARRSSFTPPPSITDFTAGEMALLGTLITGPPAINRHSLSREFCWRIGWPKPDSGRFSGDRTWSP